MTLRTHIGPPKQINTELLFQAVEHGPTLFIDCVCVANPHAVFPFIPIEKKLQQVYVMEVEMLYKLRDVIKAIPQLASGLGIKNIVITTFTRLFHYDDERENKDIYDHVWELLRDIGKKFNVTVGVEEGTVHVSYAKHTTHLDSDSL